MRLVQLEKGRPVSGGVEQNKGNQIIKSFEQVDDQYILENG